MHKILIILSVLVVNGATSQDLHIYYNMWNDSLWYMKNGKYTEDLSVRKDKNVFFHVIEINNYLYTAKFTAEQLTIDPEAAISSPESFSNKIPGILGSLLPGGGGGGLPFMNIPIFGELLSAVSAPGSATKQRDGWGAKDEAELNDKLNSLKVLLEDLEEMQEEINQLVKDINHREKVIGILSDSLEKLDDYYLDENIHPTLIKDFLMSYFQEALMIDSGQSFLLKDIAPLNQKLMEVPSLRSTLSNKLQVYQAGINELVTMRASINLGDRDNEDLLELFNEFEEKKDKHLKYVSDLENKINRDSMNLSKGEEKDYTRQIKQLYVKFVQLSNNHFEYTHHTRAVKPLLFYTLSITKKVSGRTEQELFMDTTTYVKNIKIKIKTYGDFKISTSVGISGASFRKTPEKYFIVNNVLASEKTDQYLPLISSFVNLSYSSKSLITPGVSIGVGVPVTASENTGSLAIFVGPLIKIGKSKSFELNGGYMFSKVERLSKGVKVGDILQLGAGDIPKQRKYEGGYFIGLSYSL